MAWGMRMPMKNGNGDGDRDEYRVADADSNVDGYEFQHARGVEHGNGWSWG